jgi:hypothetical protein
VFGELAVADAGVLDAARRGQADEPAELEQPVRERRAEGAGEVRPSLAPVQTGAGECPARAAGSVDVDAQRPQLLFAGRGEREVGAGELEPAAGDECVGEFDAQRAREVVVAGSAGAQVRDAIGSA